MPIGVHPYYQKSTTREKLIHGPTVFNNKGNIVMTSNNFGSLFKNFKYRNTSRVHALLNKVDPRYHNNVSKMVRQVKNARKYGLSEGNIKHKYMYEYWKWLTHIVPEMLYYKSGKPGTYVKSIYKRNNKKSMNTVDSVNLKKVRNQLRGQVEHVVHRRR